MAETYFRATGEWRPIALYGRIIGSVEFEMMIEKGGILHANFGDGVIGILGGTKTIGHIIDNELRDINGDIGVELLAQTEDLNIDGELYYRATYHFTQVGTGTRIKQQTVVVEFPASTDDTPIDLNAYEGEPGAPDISSFPTLPVEQLSNATAFGRAWLKAATPEAARVLLADQVSLHSLFRPMNEIVSAGTLELDYYRLSSPSGDYTNYTLSRWDSGKFNLQGQNWVSYIPGSPSYGCINDSTGRVSGDNPFPSIIDFEFLFTGDKLDIAAQAYSLFDSQVYIEDNGVMKKAKHLPLALNGYSGVLYRSLRFSEIGTRRIRIVLPATNFIGIYHEQSAVIAPSPDRPLMLITGDSYVEASGGYNEDSERTFFTFGLCDQIMELTGFALARCAQGGTGYFNDGQGGTSLTPVGARGTSPFFSDDRKPFYQMFLAEKPVLMIVNGTINDGELSGGQAGQQARLAAALDWITDQDDYCSIAIVGPEPFNGSYVPTTTHTLNRAGQRAAVADKAGEMEHGATCIHVDANNPNRPFFTGSGSEADPDSTSQQATLTGMDGIHGNWFGYKHYGTCIVNELRKMSVSKLRAMGLA
jgi:hypothetical protein